MCYKMFLTKSKTILLAILMFSIFVLFVGCTQPPETTKTYEVLSVYQYPRANTNGYGGVQGYDVGYHVSYIDENGNVGEVDFVNQSDWDNPNRLVTIGEETKIIISDSGKITLYLTREDFEKMNVKIEEIK